MVRGRARAKQTKVARELKYRSVNTDFASLERELRGHVHDDEDEDDTPDPYAELAERYGVDESYLNDDEDANGY